MSPNWWIDCYGAWSDDPIDSVYLCEGEDGDVIRLTTQDMTLAESLRDKFNAEGLTRDQADPIIREAVSQ